MPLCPQGQHSKRGTKLLSGLAWSLQNQRNNSPKLSCIQSSCIGSSPHHPVALYLRTGIGTTHSCPCISACSLRVSVRCQKTILVNHMAQVWWLGCAHAQRLGWPQVQQSGWGQHLQSVLHGLGGQQGSISLPLNIAHHCVASLAPFCHHLSPLTTARLG